MEEIKFLDSLEEEGNLSRDLKAERVSLKEEFETLIQKEALARGQKLRPGGLRMGMITSPSFTIGLGKEK